MNQPNEKHKTLEDFKREYGAISPDGSVDPKKCSKAEAEYIRHRVFTPMYENPLTYPLQVNVHPVPGTDVSKLRMPIKSTPNSACYDLHMYAPSCNAANPGVIYPGNLVAVPTGLAIDFPEGYHGRIYIRSSMSAKNKLSLANGVGIIDEDYTDEIKVLIINLGERSYSLYHGDRIAQLEIVKTNKDVEFCLKDTELIAKEGRSGGFGSTGR